MKKVGIITFHRSHNCGSILQAYALQNTLKNRFNLDNEIIDFSNPNQERLYSTLIKPYRYKDVLRNGLFSLLYFRLERHRKEYDAFIQKHLVYSTERCKTSADMEKIADRYSAFITGSDQVWNTKCGDADDVYYLNFVTGVPKFAYAVSMGANNILGQGSEKEEHYRQLIKDFNLVTVRERNAQIWLKKLAGLDVKIAADPTLLLERDEWEKLAQRRVIEGDYIFYYSFGYDAYYSEIVAHYAKKLGLPVYVIEGKQWLRKKLFKYGFKLIEHNGPDVFLALVRDAKYLFTTSLHGTIFSTIFEKKFWYITPRTMEELSGNDDDRAVSLLTQLRLLNRFVTKEELASRDIDEAVDYKATNESKKLLVSDSMDILSCISNKCKEGMS